MTPHLAPTESLLTLLAGGDKRSIGRADEVLSMVLADPTLFPPLIDGLDADDPLVRMRCADAAEKISRTQPTLLLPHKARLLDGLATCREAELRWHLAPMVARLPLSPPELDAVVRLLDGDLQHRSRIVRTLALQALVDLALIHPDLRPGVHERLLDALASISPAVRARARKLLATFPLPTDPPPE